MQEVLVLIVIALAIFYLPRVLGRRPVPEPEIRLPVLTGWMRLAILVSVLWVSGFALFLKPWEGATLIFLSVGLGPVAVLWGGVWIWSGYKKYGR